MRPDPLGAFRLIRPEVCDRIILAAALAVLVFWALPDLFAWLQGLAPVGVCK